MRDIFEKKGSYRLGSDHRSEIERDYGRAVFSTPVRRLQDKTQVFPLEPMDAVRTRLTHSIEVSCIAHDLSFQVTQWLRRKKEVSYSQAYQVQCIAKTCGLIHDIGNPPFGHAGEEAIKSWFAKQEQVNEKFWIFEQSPNRPLRSDFINFDGNAQTIRLVSKLQVLGDLYGLNFTAATLSALLKYVAGSDSIDTTGKDHTRSKLGYFQSETDVITTVHDAVGTEGRRNPITFLVEAADDICYCSVDLEDAIKKRILSWQDVTACLKSKIGAAKYAQLVRKTESRIKASPPEILFRPKDIDEACSRYFRTMLIAFGVGAVISAFKTHYDEIMGGTYKKELLYDSTAGKVFIAIKKEICRKRIYRAHDVVKLEVLGKRVIEDLLDMFSQCEAPEDLGATKTFGNKIYALMSQNYRTVFENHGKSVSKLPREYLRLLLMTDYVCGMTDSFAMNLHRELSNG